MANQLQYQAKVEPLIRLPLGPSTPSTLGWMSPLSEPKLEAKYHHPVFAQSYVPPFGIIISQQLPFGWFSPLAEVPKKPVFDQPNHQLELNNQTFNTGNNTFALSIWHQPQPKKQFFYQAKVETPQPFSGTVTPTNFGWFAQENTNPNNLGLSVALGGFLQGVSAASAPFSIPTDVAWQQPLSEPFPLKKFHYHTLSPNIFVTSNAAIVPPIGWLQQLDTPLAKGRWTIPTSLIDVLEVWPPSAVTFGWFIALSEPVRQNKYQQYLFVFRADVGTAPTPPAIAGWYQPLSEHVKWRPIIHEFPAPVLARTNPPAAPVAGWYPQLAEPVKLKPYNQFQLSYNEAFIDFTFPIENAIFNATLPMLQNKMTGTATTFGRSIRLPEWFKRKYFG